MSHIILENGPVQSTLMHEEVSHEESSYESLSREESAPKQSVPKQSAHNKSIHDQSANGTFSQPVMDKQSPDPHTPHEKNKQPGMPQTQNPELLHWRANVLLDEMMLGAIDIAAGDSVPARALTPKQSSASTAAKTQSTSPTANYTASQANGSTRESESHQPVPPQNGMTNYQQPTARADGGTATSTLQSGERYVAQPNAAQPQSKPQPDSGQSQPSHGTEQWLFAAEQRYQQIAARQQANRQSTPASGYDGWSMAAHEQDQSTLGNPYSSSGYGYDSSSVDGVSSASVTEYGTNRSSFGNGTATRTSNAQPSTVTASFSAIVFARDLGHCTPL